MPSLKNQQAELRAVIAFENTYAFIGHIDVRGPDIYCATREVAADGSGFERFRVSYHSSGASRTHITSVSGRKVTFAHALPEVPPSELKGAMMMTNGARVLADRDYNYRLRVDSGRRRTLVVSPDEVKYGLNVKCWALEARNEEALEIVRGVDSNLNVVGYVLADWVTRLCTERPACTKSGRTAQKPCYMRHGWR